MAYHFGNRTLGEVAEADTIDELDSCAYSLLAALFSIVEPQLHEKRRAWYSSKRTKKSEIDQAHRDFKDGRKADRAVLETILPKFGQPLKVAQRFQNAKLSFLFQQALAGDTAEFFEACCSIMAHLEMADLPGAQCTAVIRDAERNLYITGNGLWASAGAIRDSRELVDDPGDGWPSRMDEPWFSSWGSFWAALTTVTGDMLAEYNLRSIRYVNPETGDFGGKFHAEMQLLDFMIEENIVPERGYMGVSKPCCQYCKNWLQQAGIRFWNEHGIHGGDPNDQVSLPYGLYKQSSVIMEYRTRVRQVRFYGAEDVTSPPSLPERHGFHGGRSPWYIDAICCWAECANGTTLYSNDPSGTCTLQDQECNGCQQTTPGYLTCNGWLAPSIRRPSLRARRGGVQRQGSGLASLGGSS